MKKISRLVIFTVVFIFCFTVGSSYFADSNAWERKRNPTQSSIKARGKAGYEKGMARWDALSPEQQEYFEKKGKERAGQAKMTGEEYWNSLSDDEKEEALTRASERSKKARKRWQNLPE